MPKSGKSAGRRRRQPPWVRLKQEQLLDLPLNKLDLHIEGTHLEDRIARLFDELDARRMRFRPHFWLAEEWFSPDGIPGVAIPFFLAHSKLMKLEKTMMYEVEGGTEGWCMRILRHETGHALDSAYQLHRRRRWRELFGRFSDPYPEYYQPKPYSKRYVLHLDSWYAQSHPAEDFAETFAVWLRPRFNWRNRYQGWPALKKLSYVDELMSEIADMKPPVRSQRRVEPIDQLKKTLREHYEEKRRRYGTDYPEFYDRDLRKLFSESPEPAGQETAAAFLRRMRPELRRRVSHWTGEYQYTIDQVLKEMIERSKELKLRVRGDEQQTMLDATVMVTVQAMNYLHSGHHRVAL